MANDDQIAILRSGVNNWRHWQKTNRSVRADLYDADLSGMQLDGVLLSHAELVRAKLTRASLRDSWLVEANLRDADLSAADLAGASLARANFSKGTNASQARFSGANLLGADLGEANLSGAILTEADLRDASLRGTDLTEANLTGANLSGAILVGTKLVNADLTGCRIYGISAWDLDLTGASQKNLVITLPGQPEITVDNLEVGQFIYLLLHNEKIRDVIETVTSKAVLILGRFTPSRKPILDAIREELRKRNYLPVLFDFEGPASRDITETVSLLARMARFIVADLTDPSSIPKELEAIVPELAVPVQPLLQGSRPYAMFQDYWKYDWVLPVFRYDDLGLLLQTLNEKVITPAEAKVKALEERRRTIGIQGQ